MLLSQQSVQPALGRLACLVGGEGFGREAKLQPQAVDQCRDRHRLHPPIAFGHAIFGEKRSEEHTSELQSLMRISYAVFCLKKKKTQNISVMHNPATDPQQAR